MKGMKTNSPWYRSVERMMKGIANHRRVQILDLLSKQSELSLAEITGELNIDYRTASEHLRKLAIAGLIMKRHDGNSVRHALTDRGQSILKFCRITV